MRTAIPVMHNDSLCHCLKYMSETPKQTINMKQKISDEEELNELEKSDLPYGVLVVLCNWPGCSMCQCKFYKLEQGSTFLFPYLYLALFSCFL